MDPTKTNWTHPKTIGTRPNLFGLIKGQGIGGSLCYNFLTKIILFGHFSVLQAAYEGQVAVMTCNMRSPREAIIGDTFHLKGNFSFLDKKKTF